MLQAFFWGEKSPKIYSSIHDLPTSALLTLLIQWSLSTIRTMQISVLCILLVSVSVYGFHGFRHSAPCGCPAFSVITGSTPSSLKTSLKMDYPSEMDDLRDALAAAQATIAKNNEELQCMERYFISRR